MKPEGKNGKRSSTASSAANKNASNGSMVYILKHRNKNNKYHLSSQCYHISSKEYENIPLKEAEKAGHEACKDCSSARDPPKKDTNESNMSSNHTASNFQLTFNSSTNAFNKNNANENFRSNDSTEFSRAAFAKTTANENTSNGPMVYILKSRNNKTRYHSSSQCYHINLKEYEEIPLEEVEKAGYEECKDCRVDRSSLVVKPDFSNSGLSSNSADVSIKSSFSSKTAFSPSNSADALMSSTVKALIFPKEIENLLIKTLECNLYDDGWDDRIGLLPITAPRA